MARANHSCGLQCPPIQHKRCQDQKLNSSDSTTTSQSMINCVTPREVGEQAHRKILVVESTKFQL